MYIPNLQAIAAAALGLSVEVLKREYEPVLFSSLALH
jgi:hypothetical protein